VTRSNYQPPGRRHSLERQFEAEEQRFNRMFKFAFVLWLLWVLICLGLLIAGVWVAAHFIQKWW
jgi:hypothetical protein